MKKKPSRDENEIAFDIVSRVAGENRESSRSAASEAARALSKLGASKGGKARAQALTKARRKEIARNAANSRWRDRS